jgi:hypothetical protein
VHADVSRRAAVAALEAWRSVEVDTMAAVVDRVKEEAADVFQEEIVTVNVH